MLSYKQALEKIEKHSFVSRVKRVPLRECLGQVLARDLFAPEPFPAFDNSAVDGYAVGAMTGELKVLGEIRAGDFFRRRLKPGEAVRIYTGAPVPPGARAVVMQEHTERANGTLRLLKNPSPRENIRFRGEDFPRGKRLIRRGTPLAPAHLALLQAVGYQKAPVYPAPRVALLATGSELLKEGERPQPGKIRDSNTLLLETMVREAGGISHPLPKVGDDPRKIRAAVRTGLKSEIFLIAGGVSVGKYDFVKEALEKAGVMEIFWKVDIKPGKPLYFGKKGRTLVFGLPGNPVSVFVTFLEFVKPAILRMRGRVRDETKRVRGSLARGFRNGKRFHFVRVRCRAMKSGVSITPLSGQGSHQIGELAAADALLAVEPDAELKKGDRVSVKKIQEAGE